MAERTLFTLSPIARRRWENFRANKRAYYSLWIFAILYAISLCAELVANDKPLLVSYRGEILSPILFSYPETRFGGDFQTEADYSNPEVQCLIRTGGDDACFDAVDTEPTDAASAGWIAWPLVKWSYDTINKTAARLPAPPSSDNYLGTDQGGRDVLALTIYGVRLSVSFGVIVTLIATIVGVAAGAAQGYFGGWIDLFFQRVIEIWSALPLLFVIMIVTAIIQPSFWLLVFVITFFSWTALVPVVRAEFLRARNFEYVMAARALGVSDGVIMFKHVLPNAMVATLTMLPFILTQTIGLLAMLDFLGFGLQENNPSLGVIGLQAKNNLNATWLILTAIFTFGVMLSLLVFIFEGVRDAFDPRKTFSGPEPAEDSLAEAAKPAPRAAATEGAKP